MKFLIHSEFPLLRKIENLEFIHTMEQMAFKITLIISFLMTNLCCLLKMGETLVLKISL